MTPKFKRNQFYKFLSLMVFISLFTGSCKEDYIPIKMNQIQLIGSHNSYKLRIQKELWQQIYSRDSLMAMTLDYGHASLSDQLNMGIRGLELDVYHDPVGGRYAAPYGNRILSEMGVPLLTYDPEGKMNIPGLKVFHVQEIDFRSHFYLFKEGLEQLKQWSLSNPDHMPIIVTINAKDGMLDIPDFVQPLAFNASALDSIDGEIRSIFDESHLITPDLVRGDSKSLKEAVLSKGWPSVDRSKGKIMFVLDEFGKKRKLYIKDHPSLKQRVMFIPVAAGSPESAFFIINDPVKSQNKIRELVKKGYMVRTRADADTWEARKADYKRWNMALQSGAQLISTDYYKPDTSLTSYHVKFKEREEYRLNPLFALQAD